MCWSVCEGCVQAFFWGESFKEKEIILKFRKSCLKKKKNLLCGVCFISGRSYFCLEPGKG